MSGEIRVPVLGESVVEATISKWLKQEGETIHAGEPLLELETDKVNLEVPADQDGVLISIARAEGDTVQIGDVLGHVGEAGDGAGADSMNAPAATAQAALPPPPAQSQPQPDATHSGQRTEPLTPDVQATPVAQRIASEHAVDLRSVPGSGEHGRVTKDDVIGYIEQAQAGNAGRSDESHTPAPPPAPAAAPPTPASGPPALAMPVGMGASESRHEERVPMTRRRQTIAQRLLEAQHNAAMLTTFNEIDMHAIMDVRQRRKAQFKERHEVNLGFMSFFVKAVVGALKAFPLLNAEIQGTDIVVKHYYDIGIAVGTEHGLVVPVVRDADRKSFAAIERDIVELATRARERTLALADLQGGTFSITNGGIYGSLMSTPILNTPQVGILGMHKIEERPVALSGEVVIRPMMYVALSYDHRIVDGSDAVRFLVRVKELVEDPEALLLEG